MRHPVSISRLLFAIVLLLTTAGPALTASAQETTCQDGFVYEDESAACVPANTDRMPPTEPAGADRMPPTEQADSEPSLPIDDATDETGSVVVTTASCPESIGENPLGLNPERLRVLCDEPIAGLTIGLFGPEGSVAEDVSGESGPMVFEDIPAGDYVLQAVPPDDGDLVRVCDALADLAMPNFGETIDFTVQPNVTINCKIIVILPPSVPASDFNNSVHILYWVCTLDQGKRDAGLEFTDVCTLKPADTAADFTLADGAGALTKTTDFQTDNGGPVTDVEFFNVPDGNISLSKSATPGYNTLGLSCFSSADSSAFQEIPLDANGTGTILIDPGKSDSNGLLVTCHWYIVSDSQAPPPSMTDSGTGTVEIQVTTCPDTQGEDQAEISFEQLFDLCAEPVDGMAISLFMDDESVAEGVSSDSGEVVILVLDWLISPRSDVDLDKYAGNAE